MIQKSTLRRWGYVKLDLRRYGYKMEDRVREALKSIGFYALKSAPNEDTAGVDIWVICRLDGILCWVAIDVTLREKDEISEDGVIRVKLRREGLINERNLALVAKESLSQGLRHSDKLRVKPLNTFQQELAKALGF